MLHPCDLCKPYQLITVDALLVEHHVVFVAKVNGQTVSIGKFSLVSHQAMVNIRAGVHEMYFFTEITKAVIVWNYAFQTFAPCNQSSIVICPSVGFSFGFGLLFSPTRLM